MYRYNKIIKRYCYGDIVIFKVNGNYIEGKIVGVFPSYYMIIVDGVVDGRSADGIFRIGVGEVELIRSKG